MKEDGILFLQSVIQGLLRGNIYYKIMWFIAQQRVDNSVTELTGNFQKNPINIGEFLGQKTEVQKKKK